MILSTWEFPCFDSIVCPTINPLKRNHNNCRLLCHLLVILKVIFANSVDPDQTAPLGAVWSGSTLFALCKNRFEKFARIFSRWHKQTTFSDAGFLGVLRVNMIWATLWKHPYSNILKILPPKNWKFSAKNSDIFHISAQNIDCWYTLEPPSRGSSNEYPHYFSANQITWSRLLLQIYILNPKECRSRSVGFFRSQLI